MDKSLIFKALSNENRQQILQWLRHPEKNFDSEHICKENSFEKGVCVKAVQDKAGLAQSVTSNYLDMLHKSGLLESSRIGKWTYYRRNEEVIQDFAEFIKNGL
jgi:DNA-binding transcriptional ArsR family regulator